MRDCPKLGSLLAKVERQESETHPEEEPSVIGSLQLLNAIKVRLSPVATSKGLMYVEAHINGKATQALVDTGATHNFITDDEARHLGLSWSTGKGWLKTVNAKA